MVRERISGRGFICSLSQLFGSGGENVNCGAKVSNRDGVVVTSRSRFLVHMLDA